MLKQSGKVALGGVMGGLSLVCMILSFIQIGSYALPAIAGAVLIPVVIEAGLGTGWMVYGAVALLSLIVAQDLEAKVLFLSFFGYYPILKSTLEHIHKRWIEWLVKLVLFNTAMVISYLFMLFVFHLSLNEFVIGGVNLALVFLLVGNAVFVVYDLALSSIVVSYLRVLHPKLARIFHISGH